MSTASQGEGLRAIALEEIKLSTTGSQAERRAHFDKAAIAELASSIKLHGVLVPVIARPVNGHFELVAGERRYIAAKTAGVAAINVHVRILTDDEVLEIQLIENLQREGLHELAEAEGYEALQKRGHSAEEIAAKVGKSKAYIYGRMKLLALGPAAREAFYRGAINASIALLLARIPVASVQRDAVGEITNPRYNDGPLSFREARDFIEREYMLRLADAPFPTGDAELSKAGACGPCPKRTGNQAELFADVKSKDVCTDPVCFKLKREAWAKHQIEEAKAGGQPVISGPQAKKIAQHGHVSGGFVKLEDRCWEDSKNRTFKQLLGKNAETKLLQMPKTGDVIEVVEKAAALKQLKKDGVIKPREASNAAGAKPKKDPAVDKLEQAYLERLYLAVHAKAPKKLGRDQLVSMIDHELDVLGSTHPAFEKAWEMKDGGFSIAQIKKMSEPDLQQLLWEITTVFDEYSAGDEFNAGRLAKVAKDLGIDTKAIRKEASTAIASEIPKTKKKAARKGK
jgi:ParB/RepB/Spo0J family partition protein